MYHQLIEVKKVRWQNRAHFFTMSTRLMRRILADFDRSKGYQKRDDGGQRVTLDDALLVGGDPGRDLVALDDALNAFAELDPRKSQVVELRLFGGLTVQETAEC